MSKILRIAAPLADRLTDIEPTPAEFLNRLADRLTRVTDDKAPEPLDRWDDDVRIYIDMNVFSSDGLAADVSIDGGFSFVTDTRRPRGGDGPPPAIRTCDRADPGEPVL